MTRDGASRSSQVQGNHRGRDWLRAVVSGIFAGAQQEYAEHRIATFPVGTDKRPAITNYQRVGLRASEALAARYGNSSGLGFMTSARSRIAVLDVDSTDERIFADALSRYGDTPVKVQTGSGKFHALSVQWRAPTNPTGWRGTHRYLGNWGLRHRAPERDRKWHISLH
jgi:hypothetical protein